MQIFMSYSSRNRKQVLQLVDDLQDIGHDVWIDQTLIGGQMWWDEILAHIRNSQAFVFALTPEYIKSVPCQREVAYAQALQRPLVPVLLADVDIHLLPVAIQSLQLIDYRNFDKIALKRLVRALNMLPIAPDLPEPLPPAPPAPISQLAGITNELQNDTLSPETQATLLEKLTITLGTSEGDDARDLLLQLRKHPQVTVQIAQEIDRVLAEDTFVSASATFAPIMITKDGTHYHFSFDNLRVMHDLEILKQLTHTFFIQQKYHAIPSNNANQMVFARGTSNAMKRSLMVGNPQASGHIQATITLQGETPTQIQADVTLTNHWQQIWLEADFRYFQSELEEFRQTAFQGEYTQRYSESLRRLARFESYWESFKVITNMTFSIISITVLAIIVGVILAQWLAQTLPFITYDPQDTNILLTGIMLIGVFVVLPTLAYGYMKRIQTRVEKRVLTSSQE
jgi:hypothetical protein